MSYPLQAPLVTEQAGVDVYDRYLLRTSVETTIILRISFVSISPNANFWLVSRLGYNRFLTKPFPFIIHQSSCPRRYTLTLKYRRKINLKMNVVEKYIL
jgi:hypothetical protein